MIISTTIKTVFVLTLEFLFRRCPAVWGNQRGLMVNEWCQACRHAPAKCPWAQSLWVEKRLLVDCEFRIEVAPKSDVPTSRGKKPLPDDFPRLKHVLEDLGIVRAPIHNLLIHPSRTPIDRVACTPFHQTRLSLLLGAARCLLLLLTRRRGDCHQDADGPAHEQVLDSVVPVKDA